VFFTILGFASGFRFPLAGFVSLWIAAISLGYYFATLQLVIQSTAHGDDKLPKWPEFGDWWADILEPALKWLGTLVVCFGPAVGLIVYGGVAAAISAGGGGAPANGGMVALAGILFLVGLVGFPMALLAVAMFDSLSALNPLLIVRSVIVAPLHYILMTMFLGGLFAANVGVQMVVEAMNLPIVGSLITSFVSLYASLLFARVLGVFYRVNKGRLGWF
jgi:hypothetical protein